MQKYNDNIVIRINAELEELIPLFLDKRQKDIVDIRNAISTSDKQRIAHVGHNLKGIGTGYGFTRISEIGATMEEAGKKGDLNSATSCIDELEEYLDRVVIEFV